MNLVECLVMIAGPYLEDWERKAECNYARHLKLEALRKRHHWRLADIPRLQELGIPSSAARYVEKALETRRRGRGVVAQPMTLGTTIIDHIKKLKILSDPSTPAHVRRSIYKTTVWFPYFVEAAYRGELERACATTSERSVPKLRAHMIAEERVAQAAGISCAQVRALSHRVRRDGAALPDEPPTSAAELRKHLEKGIL